MKKRFQKELPPESTAGRIARRARKILKEKGAGSGDVHVWLKAEKETQEEQAARQQDVARQRMTKIDPKNPV